MDSDSNRARPGDSPTPTAYTRRDALGQLAKFLAGGFLPGGIKGAEKNPPAHKTFRFAAVNDLHHASPECDAWHEAIFRKVAAYAPAFVLGLGDLTEDASPESFAAIERVSRFAGVPFYPVPGNHDNETDNTTGNYARQFPGRSNYIFTQSGWQFIGLDSANGTAWHGTLISEKTLTWLDTLLPHLDIAKPTIVFTHFPIAPNIALVGEPVMTPLNADALLARFKNFNLRAVLSGHYHACTEHKHGRAILSTNACCGRIVKNHDGETPKGWQLFTAHPDGCLERTFMPLEEKMPSDSAVESS